MLLYVKVCKKLSACDSFLHESEVLVKDVRDLLESWPKNFIRTSDLARLLGKAKNACYLFIKRALRSGLLIRLRRGLYIIANKVKMQPLDEFELALFMYGPSFVSLESALSHHGWIPEAVYVVTSVSAKRAREFKTPICTFMYVRVPSNCFYTGVDRIETKTGAIFVASPWRAIADLMYTRRKCWASIAALEGDLRIDKDIVVHSDTEVLHLLKEKYPSLKVRRCLGKLLKEIKRGCK